MTKEEQFNKFLELLYKRNIKALKKFPNINEYVNGIEEFPRPNRLPLFYTLNSKLKEESIFLIENGADVNKMFEYRLDSMSGENVYPILSALICSEADNAGGEETVEEYKQIMNDLSMIELLLAYKVDVNKPTEGGKIPLDWAHNHDRKKVKKLLKKHGAKHSKRFFEESFKPYFPDKKLDYLDIPYIDKTLPKLHYEVKRGYQNHLKLKEDIDLYFLPDALKRGEPINQKDWKGRTALDFAIEIGNYVAEEYLRQNGAKTAKELE